MDNVNSLKLQRKLQKYKNILLKDLGLQSSNKVTKNLMICNAGLMNRITKEDILKFFEQYGPIKNVATFPNKSYSFVNFLHLSDALQCYNAANGIKKIAGLCGPVYLLYVENVPELVDRIPDFLSKPPGLVLIEDFVTESEEDALLNLIEMESFEKGMIKHRQVKHFGFEFKYNTNNVDKDNPLSQCVPLECDFLWKKLSERGHILSQKPNQLTVNNYLPGQGIPPHIDTHSSFSDPILSLSLGSDISMDFKKGGKQHISVHLPRRSLLIISGESRYAWTHGITPKKSDIIMLKDGGLTVKERSVRTSFTFRSIQSGECDCMYPEFCDSQGKPSIDIPDNVAPHLEAVHVHEVYDHISEHFDHTRHTPWPRVLTFVNSFPSGSILIDVGCGNGKYFGFNKGIFEVGTDMSSKLAFTCKNRGFEIIHNNCLRLPFVTGMADGIISIAVIHHLASTNRRSQAIKEIVRVLKVGGKALVYVWAKNQSKGEIKSTYLKSSKGETYKNNSHLPNSIQSDYKTFSVCKRPQIEVLTSSETCMDDTKQLNLPVHNNRTEFKFQDLFVPWKLQTAENNEASTFLRFYHVFEENELEELCTKIPGVMLISNYYDQGNWCVIFQKV